jgi:hypothetical protein
MSCRYHGKGTCPPGRGRDRAGSLKLQSSLEFILIFSLLLIILAVGATVAWVRVYGINQANRNLEIESILNKASSKIDLAFLEGNGFTTVFVVPSNVFGRDYTIEIHRNNVVIYFSESTYSKGLLTENITGNISKGANTVTNVWGEIVIS